MIALEDRLRAALAAKSDAVTLTEYEAEPIPAEVIRLVPAIAGRPERRIPTLLAAVAAAAVLALGVGTLIAGRGDGSGTDHVGNRTQIPWSRVGPGWTLVQESPRTAPAGDHRVATGDEQVQLVGPGGLRYRIASLGSRSWVLVDWDEIHQRALLQSPIHEVAGQLHRTTDLAVLDLRSGTRSSFTIQDAPYDARLGGPDGGHVILTVGYTITTYSLTGQLERRLAAPASSGRTTDSQDGQQVFAGGAAGLQVYDYASGRLVTRFPAPAGYGGCYDARWSGDGTLLASCLRGGKVENPPVTIVFSVDGAPAAGRQDPRYRPVGDRVTGFRQGTVSTFYPLDDPQQPASGSWPLLTRMTAARLDSTGRTSPIAVPAQFRAGFWMIADVTSDTFTVASSIDGNPSLLSAAVSWNPFTGKVSELVRSSTPGAVLLEVEPWGEQPY